MQRVGTGVQIQTAVCLDSNLGSAVWFRRGNFLGGTLCAPGLKPLLRARDRRWPGGLAKPRAGPQRQHPVGITHRCLGHALPLCLSEASPPPWAGGAVMAPGLQRRRWRPVWNEKVWSVSNGWWGPGEGSAWGGVLRGVPAGGRAR